MITKNQGVTNVSNMKGVIFQEDNVKMFVFTNKNPSLLCLARLIQ